MKKVLIFLCMAMFMFGCCPCKQQNKSERKVGVAMYTFHKRTLEDVLPILKEMGIDTIGLSRTPLSAKFPKVSTSPKMNAQQRAFLKKLLADNNIKIASFGVMTPKDEAEMISMLEFAKEFNIPLLLSESVGDMLPIWEKNCAKYGIPMALHNHGSDSVKHNSYFNPNIVKDAIKDYKWIFACPDNGHWARSGIDSVAGFKILEGKIKMLHFKDINAFGDIKGHAVPLGTGALDMKSLLAELDRQNLKDVYFMIEYEWKPTDNVADVKACVDFLRKN